MGQTYIHHTMCCKFVVGPEAGSEAGSEAGLEAPEAGPEVASEVQRGRRRGRRHLSSTIPRKSGERKLIELATTNLSRGEVNDVANAVWWRQRWCVRGGWVSGCACQKRRSDVFVRVVRGGLGGLRTREMRD